MSNKMAFKKVNINQMTLENWKEKIPESVKQVQVAEKDEFPIYKIQFKNLDEAGYITQNDSAVRFIHSCEKSAGGSSCSHIAIAGAVADLVGLKVDRVGFTKSSVEPLMEPLVKGLDFEDVSEDFDVLTPVKTSSTTSAASTATKSSKPNQTTAVSTGTKRDWKDGWNDVQDYLQQEGLSTRHILLVRDKRKVLCDTVGMTPMAVEPMKPDFPYTGEMLGRALRHILMGKDLILVGDKGSGKDTLVGTLAWIFGLPMHLQTGNADETKESVVGENTIVQGDKGMEVEFKKTSFATSVEQGGLSHLAELNMLSGDVTSIFHSVLDDNRQLSTQNGSIERHDGHIFIGSINQGEQYSGVKQLNGALKDRCSILELPYVQDFKDMIERKTSLSDPHAINFLSEVKGAIDFLVVTEQQGEESKTIRGYIDAAEYLSTYGITFESKVEAPEDFIINKTTDFEEKMAVRDIIRRKAWEDLPMSAEEEEYVNGGM